MKLMSKLILATALCLSSAGIAAAAITPTFDIDFYGGDTDLIQGVYDSNTNINLADGESVSVNILVSGFDEQDNGLFGWKLRLNYGLGLEASNLENNTSLWHALGDPNIPATPNNQEGWLAIEGNMNFGLENSDVEGDDLLLFSFDLTATNSSIASGLTLWDFDQGGRMVDILSLNGEDILDGFLPVELATINADNPVPVPAAVWLLGSGLTSLLAIRRRKSL